MASYVAINTHYDIDDVKSLVTVSDFFTTFANAIANLNMVMYPFLEIQLIYFFLCMKSTLDKFTTNQLFKVKKALTFYFTLETSIVCFWMLVSVLVRVGIVRLLC